MMRVRTEFDTILIVGAGPVGLSLALELIRLGHRPRIIDKGERGANTSRAAVVHARTLEVLEPLGLSSEIIAAGVVVPSFRIRDRDRILLDVDFSAIPSTYPYTLMCPQNITEQLLLNRLSKHGCAVERACEALSLIQLNDRVRVGVRSSTGDRALDARWVIGRDGSHNTVRAMSGIPFDGAAYDQSFVLADIRMEWPRSRREVTLFFSPDGLVVVAPLPEGLFRIVATVDEAPPNPPIELFRSLLRSRGPSQRMVDAQECTWSSRFKIKHRVARQLRSDRILLCEDAAHVHSPAGGQGMNIGIQDAVSLAGVLDSVLKGGDQKMLDQRAAERRKAAEGVVMMTDRLTQMATVKSPVRRAGRNILLRAAGRISSVRAAVARRLAAV